VKGLGAVRTRGGVRGPGCRHVTPRHVLREFGRVDHQWVIRVGDVGGLTLARHHVAPSIGDSTNFVRSIELIARKIEKGHHSWLGRAHHVAEPRLIDFENHGGAL
jgi:hypothetical protein